jgi:hypothetical protein
MGQYWRNIDTQPRAIPIGNGNVVAVPPQGVVEVERETPTLARLRRLGKVVRAGRPTNPEQVAKAAPVTAEAVRQRANTEFAQRTAERGRARGGDEAKRVVAQATAQRVKEGAVELAARAALKAKAEAEEVAVAEAAPAVAPEVAPAAVEAAAPVTDGTAEKSTMGKKGKRRWARASE